MKNKCAYFVLPALLIMSLQPVMADKEPKPTIGNQNFAIPESELPSLEREALRGSPDAAFRLHLYYELIHTDFQRSMYWVTIAAENGHAIGQYNLASFLLDDQRAELIHESDRQHRVQARERARYWLDQALAGARKKRDKELQQTIQNLQATLSNSSSNQSSLAP